MAGSFAFSETAPQRQSSSSPPVVLVAQKTARTTRPTTGAKLTKPSVTVLLSSTDDVLADLKYVFNLAKSERSFQTLTDTLDVFLTGIDREKPIGVRSYLVNGTLAHITSLPVRTERDLKDFLENASSLDVKSRAVPGNRNLYQLSKLLEAFLRYDPQSHQAYIGEKREYVQSVKAAPQADLLKGYDVAAVIENDAADQESRREAFGKIRKETLGGLKKKATEKQSTFDIRKLAAEHQFDELERFFVESANITLGWTTSVKDKTASLNIDLRALPETSLAESVDLLGTSPDQFAGISSEGTVLSGSVNFPIDSMRKGHLKESTQLSRKTAHDRIDDDKDLSADQKTIDREVSDLAFDIVDSVADLGVFNGFIRVSPPEKGLLCAVGAIKLPSEEKVLAILDKLAKRGGKTEVKRDVDSEGDVKIHALTLPELHEKFPEIVPDNGVVYVGTSKSAAWLASGHQALDRLKEAIKTAKTDDSKNTVGLDLTVKFRPFIEILDKRGDGPKEAKELRKMALEAFQNGTDIMHVKLERVEKDAKVHVQFHEDLIRFAGKVMAKFVSESLE